MKTEYIIIATFKDFSINKMIVVVEHIADAICLAKGYLHTTDARRITIRTEKQGTIEEYYKK